MLNIFWATVDFLFIGELQSEPQRCNKTNELCESLFHVEVENIFALLTISVHFTPIHNQISLTFLSLLGLLVKDKRPCHILAKNLLSLRILPTQIVLSKAVLELCYLVEEDFIAESFFCKNLDLVHFQDLEDIFQVNH